ncbi:MAG: hypothetical protein GY838_09950 [bacterium]|nr:hypothetical protein [bacterium]
MSIVADYIDNYFEVSLESLKFPEDRKNFWRTIHHARDGEPFRRFMRGTNTFLLVTGEYGSGKSSYIRQQLEFGKSSPPEYVGIVINLAERWDDLRNVYKQIKDSQRNIKPHDFEYAEYDLEIDKIVAETIKAKFIEHLGICITNNLGFATWRQNDFSNHIGKRTITIPTTAKHNKILSRVEQHLAAIIVLFANNTLLLERNPRKKDIRKLFDKIEKAPASINKQKEILIKSLSRNKSLRDHLIDINATPDYPQLADYWLHIYNAFFKKPSFVAFDNTDALGDAHEIAQIYAYCKKLVGKTSVYYSHHHPKTVMAVRDRNFPTNRRHDRWANENRTIYLAKRPQGLTESGHVSNLGINRDQLYSIAKNRLRFVKNIMQSDGQFDENEKEFNEYKKTMLLIIDGFWPEESQPYRDREHSLHSITNDSLRLILEYLSTATTEYMTSNELRGQRITPSSTRSFIIKWLFKRETTYIDMFLLIARECQMIKEKRALCCTHRILMSYIYKASQVAPFFTTYQTLIRRMAPIFDIDRGHVKEVVSKLAQANRNEIDRDYLSKQYPPDTSPTGELTPECEISITLRGVVFIERISITFEYWYYLSVYPEKPMHENFFRTDIVRFSRVVKKVSEFTVNHAWQHVLNWKRLVVKDGFFRRHGELPFDIYEKEFSLFRAFHMERACHSHLTTICSYLRERYGRKGLKPFKYDSGERTSDGLTQALEDYWSDLYDLAQDKKFYGDIKTVHERGLEYLKVLKMFSRIRPMTALQLQNLKLEEIMKTS